MDTVHDETTLYSTDGLALYTQRWRPTGAVRAELLIVHGYFDHGGRYRELARALAARGIASTAVDLRGHGRSAGTRGFVRRFEDYHDDVRAALASIAGGPPFALGHSMGGLVMLDFAARAEAPRALAGLVIVNPYLGLAMDVPPLKKWLGNVAADLYPKLALPSGLDPGGLSRDRAVVDAYRSDPLVFDRATAGWFRECTRAQERVGELEQIAAPLLYYWSDTDPVASPRLSGAAAARLRSPDKTVRLRAGALHEILNETDRAQVHAEIADWILARAPVANGADAVMPPRA